MTTQAISKHPPDASNIRPPATSRAFGVAGLMAVPGFMQLCLSNGLAQSFGQRLQGIAVAWLVLEMTGSTFWLGAVNGAPALSVVAFSLIGGVIADSADARRVLLISRAALTLTTLATAVLVAIGSADLEHLLLYVLLVVSLAAVDMPVSRTMVHDIVGSERLLSASSTQSVLMNLVSIVAPLTIGVLISFGGPSMAFWFLGAGYALAALLLLRTRRVSNDWPRRKTSPMADVVAGMAYIRATPAVASLAALAFLMPVAGLYFAMVPVYARDLLDVGAVGLGFLVASFSVGSLLGSVYLAANGRIARRGLSLMLLGVAFGAGMMAFALSQSLLVSCGVSLAMGVIAGLWQNLLGAMLQVASSPQMRGRVTSVFTMAYQLAGVGWLIAGTTAAVVGVEATVLGGGACFSAVSVAVFLVGSEAKQPAG
jgi:MFS family permease